MIPREYLRLAIAAYLLGHMLPTGGTKASKVQAAVEYADALLEAIWGS